MLNYVFCHSADSLVPRGKASAVIFAEICSSIIVQVHNYAAVYAIFFKQGQNDVAQSVLIFCKDRQWKKKKHERLNVCSFPESVWDF